MRASRRRFRVVAAKGSGSSRVGAAGAVFSSGASFPGGVFPAAPLGSPPDGLEGDPSAAAARAAASHRRAFFAEKRAAARREAAAASRAAARARRLGDERRGGPTNRGPNRRPPPPPTTTTRSPTTPRTLPPTMTPPMLPLGLDGLDEASPEGAASLFSLDLAGDAGAGLDAEGLVLERVGGARSPRAFGDSSDPSVEAMASRMRAPRRAPRDSRARVGGSAGARASRSDGGSPRGEAPPRRGFPRVRHRGGGGEGARRRRAVGARARANPEGVV